MSDYHVTQHAIRRFKHRVISDITVADIIDILHNVLRKKTPVAGFEKDGKQVYVYLCYYRKFIFYVPVSNNSVISVLPIKQGPYPKGIGVNFNAYRHKETWSREDVKILTILQEKGIKNTKIALIMGRTKKSIEGQCYRGRHIRKIEKNWTKHEERQAVALYSAGLPYRGIGNILGRTSNAVKIKIHRIRSSCHGANKAIVPRQAR